jgi:hypothetical protein
MVCGNYLKKDLQLLLSNFFFVACRSDMMSLHNFYLALSVTVIANGPKELGV